MYIFQENWDEKCQTHIQLGKGFMITERMFDTKRKSKTEKDEDDKKDKKEKKKKSKYGSHSPIFGTDWGDEDAFAEKHRCKCRHLMGREHEGETCPQCGHKVVFKDLDLSVTGWIPLFAYKVITPIFYSNICSAIGAKTLVEIIGIEKKINQDGFVADVDAPKDNPYYALGLINFYERFDEIMMYFMKRTRDEAKKKLIAYLIMSKDKVFTSNIPVYSSFLRPVSFSQDEQWVAGEDTKINSLVSYSIQLRRQFMEEKDRDKVNRRVRSTIHLGEKFKLKDRRKGERLSAEEQMRTDLLLYKVQKVLLVYWELVFSKVDGKFGQIRGELLGGRLNYTSRNVIIPDPTLHVDEVTFNYHTFAELFKNQIIHTIVDLHGVSYNEAYERWSYGAIYDNSLIEIMRYIIQRDKPSTFINRNPTINYGSYNVMRIRDVSADIDDFTLAMPIQILEFFNADFDGDVLNIGLFLTKEDSKEFAKIFNPRFNMYVDRNDGYFNSAAGLHKDQMIGLSMFLNL